METNTELTWQAFKGKYNLTDLQLALFKKYSLLLQEWNTKINLTAIDSLQDIIDYHFDDSLAITKFVDFKSIYSIADVGTGAGFPGIPLKIMFPDLKVVLIEVTQKKINFLNLVIKELGLEKIEVFPLDWRTFLRKSEYNIKLFLSRASLHTDELVRAFNKDSNYRKSDIIYFASVKWVAAAEDQIYLKDIKKYQVGQKERLFIFLKNK